MRQDTIEFKSAEPNFYWEMIGEKPNTVRIMTKQETEAVMFRWHGGELKNIRIIPVFPQRPSAHDNREPFERKLTNIAIGGELLGHFVVIFSWKHEEAKQ